MTKRKGRFQGRANFISEYSLEQCQQQLVTLAANQNGNDRIEIAFVPQSPDRVQFTATLRERGQVRAIGKGMLRRWEGTLTRVDCDVEVREGLVLWLIAMMGVSLVLMVSLPLLALTAMQIDTVPWAIISVLFVGIVLGAMWVVHLFSPHDDTPRNLLALIHDTLRV